MRRGLIVSAVGSALLCAVVPASASTGGAAAPSLAGGVEAGQPLPQPAGPRRMTVRQFTLRGGTVQPGGPPAVFTFRVDGPEREARVRIDIVSRRRVVRRLRLGYRRTGRAHTYAWRPLGGDLPPGEYVARLHAVDGAGRRLVRTAVASGRSPLHVARPLVVGSGIFPVRGAYDLGGAGAGFGAERPSHLHQGQDIAAAEAVPVVSPKSGFVYWKAFQDGGAGNYVVIRGDDGRDYVFMHLREPTPLAKGDRVATGQVIGAVGDTGRSTGFHLHFEIWPDGWYARGSAPIDPRPDLETWAREAS